MNYYLQQQIFLCTLSPGVASQHCRIGKFAMLKISGAGVMILRVSTKAQIKDSFRGKRFVNEDYATAPNTRVASVFTPASRRTSLVVSATKRWEMISHAPLGWRTPSIISPKRN